MGEWLERPVLMTLPTLRVGDSHSFVRDYPAEAGRSLRYVLAGPAPIEIPCVEILATPGSFAVNLTSATTATWAAGRYFWHLLSELAGDRRTIDSGTVDVLPDITASTSPLDVRTHAQRMVDAIEATLEGRVTSDTVSLSIKGRSISRIPIPELLVLRDRYKAEAAREAAALGLGPRKNKIYVRFSR